MSGCTDKGQAHGGQLPSQSGVDEVERPCPQPVAGAAASCRRIIPMRHAGLMSKRKGDKYHVRNDSYKQNNSLLKW